MAAYGISQVEVPRAVTAEDFLSFPDLYFAIIRLFESRA
jgi:hypothetical protein